ncbi:MAG: [LysW]-lysine hydrolase [Phycisphaeraceae bacterium]|nr:[LysW]-lysine hydrolase [Phycisphaeraceae bacterium]MCW5762082.1 [LysW]-lysine hydrolase [Phycisphaeraceae bacterium]
MIPDDATLDLLGLPPNDRRAVEILYDLVSTPSVSDHEGPAVSRFIQAARSLDLEFEIDEAGNGVARRRAVTKSRVQIVLLGHIDTVPGHIPVRIENRELWGRGSVDAKGPLAAMLLAGAQASIPDDTELLVVAAVGEETTASLGARHLTRELSPSACIIGEPSGWDGVTLGYKGRVLVEAASRRPSAHSGGPTGSPPDVLFAWWQRVLDHAARLSAGATRDFDRLQCTILDMTSSSDGLEDVASIRAGFRLPPSVVPAQLQADLFDIAGDEVSLTCAGRESAYATDRNDPVVRALSGAIRASGATPRPKLKTGTADLNIVAPVWQCPIAAYGPGDSGLDHTPHERLNIDEFLRSVRVLQTALATLAAELSASGVKPATVS